MDAEIQKSLLKMMTSGEPVGVMLMGSGETVSGQFILMGFRPQELNGCEITLVSHKEVVVAHHGS